MANASAGSVLFTDTFWNPPLVLYPMVLLPTLMPPRRAEHPDMLGQFPPHPL